MTMEYTHMLVSLFGVITLLLVCLYVMKKFKVANNVGDRQIKIMNAVSIGTKEKILLVEVNKTVLLLGATPSHIETLYVFNELAEETAPKQSFAEQIVRLKQEENNQAIM
jgi:flagellar protein FliO/FliZ